jgi:macrolide phosphotransferase
VLDVTRTPAYLAAVASCAVPGLDAVAVRAAREVPGDRCDLGFVTDTEGRAWVVRVPSTPAVGAELDTAADLLPLLHRRVPYGVPQPRGFLAIPEGRAVVYPYLHGRSVMLGEVTPGPGVAVEIGRAIAALHNVERSVFEEAGVPLYDAETCRTRHLADLDRGAATGHVPTTLLSRWERALEDVSAWRFAPTPVHADLTGGRFLVTFTDEENPETASVRAVTGWEHAKIADPADDFAALFSECSPEAFESIVEAYSVTRIERPDRHLRHRAKVVSELRLLSQLLDAVVAADPPLITRGAAELRALEERVADAPDLVVAEPERSARKPPQTLAAPAPGEEPVDATALTSPEPADDDTQVLKAGPAAEATAVIPPEELDRLRGASDDAAEGKSTAEASPNSSWYEVLTTTPPMPVSESADGPGDEAEVSVGSGGDADDDAGSDPAPADDAGADAAAADHAEAEPAAADDAGAEAAAADHAEADPAAAEDAEATSEPQDGSGETGDTAGAESEDTRPLVKSPPPHAPGARPARAARPRADPRRP